MGQSLYLLAAMATAAATIIAATTPHILHHAGNEGSPRLMTNCPTPDAAIIPPNT